MAVGALTRLVLHISGLERCWRYITTEHMEPGSPAMEARRNSQSNMTTRVFGIAVLPDDIADMKALPA